MAGDDILDQCSVLLQSLKSSSSDSFGNAREVRNLMDKINKRQSLRLVNSFDMPTEIQLRTITMADLPKSIR